MLEDVRALMAEFRALGLGEMQLETPGLSLKLKAALSYDSSPAPVAVDETTPVVGAMPSPEAGFSRKENSAETGSLSGTTEVGSADDLTPVRSPLVGVCYLAESPEAAPFVKEGQQVVAGDVLCTIEAMKTFSNLTAPVSGVVRQVLVADGAAVGVDDVLFTLEAHRD